MFPADPRPAIARASQLLGQRRLAEAEREIMAAFTAHGPSCGEALFLQGLVRAEQGQLSEAARLMERALPHLPPHALPHFVHGRALAMLGQTAAAMAALRRAVGLQPQMTEAWFALAGMEAQQGNFSGAESCYRRVLEAAPGLVEATVGLGAALLEQDRAAEAQVILAAALAQAAHPSLAQNLAVAQNRLGQQQKALASIALAERLDPQRKLDALKGEVLACLHRFDEALQALERALAAAPQDAGLHKKYNDLLYMLGRDGDASFLSSYDRAAADEALQLAKAGFLLTARRDAQAHQLFVHLLSRNPAMEAAVSGAATALNMMGRHDDAAALLDQALLRDPGSPGLLNGLAVTALHRNDPAKAAAMAQKAVSISPHYQHALANLGTAWRLMGDERDEALNGYDRLIRAFDLEPPQEFSSMADFNAALAVELASLHPPLREFPDQSLRGGTQTRGALFGTTYPLVALLKRRLDQAVGEYVAGLQGDAAHPLLSRRGRGFVYSGSWSSRLADQGFHVNHIHPEGWISSCYYVSVPDVVQDAQAKQGWIKFGEPRFDVGLGWRHALQPAAGRLVLFPSYTWHGTIAFHAPQPRLTIAFDVVPNRI